MQWHARAARPWHVCDVVVQHTVMQGARRSGRSPAAESTLEHSTLTLGLSALAAAHRRRRGTSSGSWKSLKCASAGMRRNQGRIAWRGASQ